MEEDDILLNFVIVPQNLLYFTIEMLMSHTYAFLVVYDKRHLILHWHNLIAINNH